MKAKFARQAGGHGDHRRLCRAIQMLPTAPAPRTEETDADFSDSVG